MLNEYSLLQSQEKRGGFIVSPLASGSSSLGFSPGWRHGVEFLGKTLYSHSASLEVSTPR